MAWRLVEEVTTRAGDKQPTTHYIFRCGFCRALLVQPYPDPYGKCLKCHER